MTLTKLQAISDRINTGTDNADISRALVVFNLTARQARGIAVFHASMSWPVEVALPPVAVTDWDGNAVASAVHDLADAPDLKDRADRRHLSFALHFAVTDVPAQGWRTYLAFYSDAPSPRLENGAETADLIVVETLRHGGDLPPVGEFLEAGD